MFYSTGNKKLTTTSPHKHEKQQTCTYCHALRFEYDPPTLCCNGGYINLAPNKVSDNFYELFVDDSEETKLFRKNICVYNTIIAYIIFCNAR